MDDYVKAHQGVPLFDEDWQKRQGLLIDGHDRLTLTINGFERANVVYISITGGRYEALFTRNAFLLLHFLAQHPNTLFAATDFKFRKKRDTRDDSIDMADERRVRDTIQHIRNKLGLSKKKSEDFFAVEGKRFDIRCAVEIKRKN